MSSTAELVKEKLDIAAFVRGYVALTPAGKNFKGLCPFHREKTPSFIVSPDRQGWHCFGCGVGGDAIAFLMRYENLEFIEALRVLAERTGVPMEAGNRDERAYAALYDINRVAKDFFVANLAAETAAAEGARRYITDRGLTDETIKEFEIGFAPNASDVLSRHLTKAGFSVVDIERAGLSFKTERGTYWDRFRGRIMFPITNHFGKVVAFTGRVLPTEGPEPTEGLASAKYVNSPETPIFSKSKILFGFSKSKRHVREAKAAVLVEGQMDFLMAWQSGVKHVAASSGTATTADHLKQIARAAETVVLAFDSDEAGQAAAERVADMAAAADLAVKIVRSDPNLKDPADIVRADPTRFAAMVAEAEPAIRFYLRRHLGEGIAGNPRVEAAALKKGIRTVLQKVKVVASPVEQAYWIREISAGTGIPERSIVQELAGIGAPVAPRAATEVAPVPSGDRGPIPRRDLILQRILSIAASEASLRTTIEKESALLGDTYAKLLSCLSSGEPIPADLGELADIVSMGSSIGPTGTLAATELSDLMKQLKIDYYRGERERLSHVIRAAERAGDDEAKNSALREFMKLPHEA